MRSVAAFFVGSLLAVHCIAAGKSGTHWLGNKAACARLIHVYGLHNLHSDETTPGAKPWCDCSSTIYYRYAILALHSDRRCSYGCSSLAGYFAVDRRTGVIYGWDIGEDRLGERKVWVSEQKE
jgi:hypothetical protein